MSSADVQMQPPPRTDPQVVRTRRHILENARALLSEFGYGGFNYAALAAVAHVSRQTVYHYWPTREELLRDMLLEGPFAEHFAAPARVSPGADARARVREFLVQWREGMDQPAIAGPMTLLISDAERDSNARETLRAVYAERLDDLNRSMAEDGVTIDSDELSILTGALLSRRFIHRVPLDDDYIDFLVENWWAARAARERRRNSQITGNDAS